MIRPVSVAEARGRGGEFRAGGTDLHARRRLGLADGEIVDLRGVAELRGIRSHPGGVRVGALTRITELATDPVIAEWYPAVAAAAGSLATPQIRSVGTVGGNLLQRNRCPYFRHPGFSCFKSGGDTCPARAGEHRHGVIFDLGACVSPHPSTLGMALLLYDARVELGDGRTITVSDLFGDGTDPGRDHRLEDGEVLVAVELPANDDRAERGAYQRATGRALAEWPIVEAACRLRLDGPRILRAMVAVGGVAPVPLRVAETEAALTGMDGEDVIAQREAAARAVVAAAPLAQTRHKLDMLPNVVFAAIRSAWEGGGGEETAVGETPLPAPPGRG